MPKKFIVDACLALDAGSKDPPAERAARVRLFLTALFKTPHFVGFTKELEQEWRKHSARFATLWLRTMRSKGRVLRLSPQPIANLRDRTLATAASGNIYDAMEKDWHLVEAALDTDRKIASSDDKARNYYANAAASVRRLRPIVWVNPATEDLADWVVNADPEGAEKRLG